MYFTKLEELHQANQVSCFPWKSEAPAASIFSTESLYDRKIWEMRPEMYYAHTHKHTRWGQHNNANLILQQDLMMNTCSIWGVQTCIKWIKYWLICDVFDHSLGSNSSTREQHCTSLFTLFWKVIQHFTTSKQLRFSSSLANYHSS